MDPRLQGWPERVRLAQAQREPIEPLRAEIVAEANGRMADALRPASVEHAVAHGRCVIGRQLGLTSPAVQRQLGVDQPDIGTKRGVPILRTLQPKAEAEIALVLERDLSRPHRRARPDGAGRSRGHASRPASTVWAACERAARPLERGDGPWNTHIDNFGRHTAWENA